MEHGFFGWIVVGLIAGVLGKWIMPGRDPGGLSVTVLIGVAGALIGGFVGRFMGIGVSTTFLNVVFATAGAALVLWIYRRLQMRWE